MHAQKTEEWYEVIGSHGTKESDRIRALVTERLHVESRVGNRDASQLLGEVHIEGSWVGRLQEQ
jgi:hypothetical protein